MWRDPNFWYIAFAGSIGAWALGKRIYKTYRSDSASGDATRAPRPPVAQTPAQRSAAQATDAPRTAPAAQWLAYVNGEPDRVPHVALVGPTGAGKTTLARAILGQRDSEIVIITAKEGDDWGGLSHIGIDDDATYTTAEQTFQALDREVKRRLIATKRKQNDAPWLTVVLDDYSTLRIVCPAADAPFKLIARLGRSLRVRLVVLSDSALVKAWGLEGEGETRANFAFLFLRRGHVVTTTVDETAYHLDTADVPRLAQASLITRAWAQLQPTPDADRLLGSLLDGGKNAETDAETDGNAETGFSAVESDFTITNLPFTTAEIAKIAASIGAEIGKTDVVRSMPRYSGRRHGAYTQHYDIIAAMLAET